MTREWLRNYVKAIISGNILSFPIPDPTIDIFIDDVFRKVCRFLNLPPKLKTVVATQVEARSWWFLKSAVGDYNMILHIYPASEPTAISMDTVGSGTDASFMFNPYMMPRLSLLYPTESMTANYMVSAQRNSIMGNDIDWIEHEDRVLVSGPQDPKLTVEYTPKLNDLAELDHPEAEKLIQDAVLAYVQQSCANVMQRHGLVDGINGSAESLRSEATSFLDNYDAKLQQLGSNWLFIQRT